MFIQYCLNNAKLWKIFFIRENIAISDLDKLNANDRIQEVLKFVGVKEEVRRKGGYDT